MYHVDKTNVDKKIFLLITISLIMANETTNTTTTTKTKEQLEKEELEFKRRIDAQFQAFLDWAEKNKHISETTKKKLIETLTDKYE